MGLDMYLYLEHYSSKFPTSEDTTGFYPPELKDIQEFHQKRNFLSKTEKYQVGYWRKANAIHHWIVENCAEGEDDCKPVYISLEDLEKLNSLCEEVLKDHSKASELLETSEGFFFGSQEYDNWYFDDLKYTVDILTHVIKFLKDNPRHWDCYYEASW